MLEKLLPLQKLKELPRTGWGLKGVEDFEAVASHVWGTSVLVLELAEKLVPEIDLLKALKMALHHDTAEIKSGDITPHDGVDPTEKSARELAGMKVLFGKGEQLALWKEMESAQTPEARFVRAMDALDMALCALHYNQEGRLSVEDATEFWDYSKARFVKMGYPQLSAELDALIAPHRPSPTS